MHPIELEPLEVESLHEAFSREAFNDFRSAAPQEWAKTNILQRYPIVLSIQYGQDTRLEFRDDADFHAANFARSHRFEAMKYVSFALASHVRYVFLLLTSLRGAVAALPVSHTLSISFCFLYLRGTVQVLLVSQRFHSISFLSYEEPFKGSS